MLRSTLMMTCAGMALLGASPAFAQDDEALIEELVVTAEKREQSLQDVPVSISAYTSEVRDRIGITSVQDLTNFTPGMQYQNNLDRVSIRGIGRLTNNLATEGGVAIYYDGIYTSSTAEAGQSPLLVDRVEILRGPQGTLYGRNSIGGAINTISKRPTREFEGEVRATLATFDRTVFEGAISGPIAEGLRFRAAVVKTDQNDGYFHNVSGGPDEGGVVDAVYYEVQLEADVGENIEAWVKYSFSKAQSRPRFSNSISPYDTANIMAPTYTVPAPFYALTIPHTQLGSVTTNPGVEDLWAFNTDTFAKTNLKDNENLTVDVVWHGPGVDVRYLGGWRSYYNQAVSDYDGTPVTSFIYPSTCPTCTNANWSPAFAGTLIAPSYAYEFIEDKSWNSHEINVTSTGDGPLQWIAGLYYYHENYSQPLHIPAPGQPQFETLLYRPDLNGTGLAPLDVRNWRRDVYYVDAELKGWSQAAFAQFDYSFNDAFKIIGGVRYTHDRKKATEQALQTCFTFASFICTPAASGNPPLPADWQGAFITPADALTDPLEPGVVDNAYRDPRTGFMTRHLRQSWSAWTGTAGAEWTPNEDVLAYARYSRGYKAGGFNAQSIQAFPTTRDEQVNAYEVGAKLNPMPGFQVNAAAYYYDYKDLQTPVTVIPASGGPGQVLFFNAPKSRSYGFELETIWRPIEPLTLLFNYAYLDAKIKEACCFVDPQDTNAQLPGAKPAASNVAGALTGTTRGQDMAGSRLPASPKHKFVVNASYEFELEPGSIVLSATYAWKDKTYYSIFNRPYNLAPSYDQVDLRATFTSADQRYSVVGYVRNAFDTLGYDGVSATRGTVQPGASAPTGQVPYGPLQTTLTPLIPRTYGVQLQYRF